MRENLEQWLIRNQLDYEFESDKVFSIKGIGRLLIIDEKEGSIVNGNFNLIVSVEENDENVFGEIEYYVYKFGTRWYYTTAKEIELVELRYLGQEKGQTEAFPFLGIHGGYDLCNGSRSYSDWCKKAKFCGIDTLGLVEENTLAGTLEFQNVCEKNGIKPIIGETVTVKGLEETYKIKLYVQNAKGWKNLLNINACINVHNERQFITEQQLIGFTEGLICVLTPEVNLENKFPIYDISFPNLYYQIDVAEWASSQKDEEWLKSIQHYISYFRKKLKPIIIQDAFYLEKEHAGIQKELNAIGKLSFRNQSSDQYFKTPKETLSQLTELLDLEGASAEEAANFMFSAEDNTKVLAQLVDFKIETGKLQLPPYKMTSQEIQQHGDKETLLWFLISEGMEVKGLLDVHNASEYADRIEEEMRVITEANLQDYFLITWDILNWAHSQGIMTGYGRGSAAGCLVAYLLGIVQVDPLQYGLLFERFLNEGRLYKKKKVAGWEITHDDGITFETTDINVVNNADAIGLQFKEKEVEIKVTGSMPDIDNDIAGERREEVKRYIEQRYGVDHVASIGTYSALKIKSALNDLARRAGQTAGTMAYISGAIEDDSLDYAGLFKYALEGNKTIKQFIQHNTELIEKLPLILGQPKTPSVHAAGVIIVPHSENGIFDQLPVKKVNGILVSEWIDDYIEQAGFLKMDILGLKQLDKFSEIIKLIEKHHDVEFSLNDIPLNDKKVYEYFSKGYNEDVFQFGGFGLKGYTRDLNPTNINDLIATAALYRPGPIEMRSHVEYVKRKSGGQITYPWGTEEILKETYGLLCYQEQVMKIVQKLADFTLNEADDIRKAIGKKLPEIMIKYRERFVQGAVKNGCPEDQAEEIWDDIEGFGGYSFNKSHAACYAITGYFCQWFKVHYPLEFWLIALKHSNDDQIANRLGEMASIDEMKIGGPNINRSTDEFTTDGQNIFWSLRSIKQVGEQAMIDILKERANGEFYSVTEFASRLKKTAVKKNTITNLILAGAFDSLHKVNESNVRMRFSILQEYLNFADSEISQDVIDMQKWENYQWTLKQRDLCGLGMINVRTLLPKVGMKERKVGGKNYTFFTLAEVLHNTEESFEKKGPIIGGILVKIEEKTSTKKADQDPFVLLEISDGTTTVSGVMWSEQYKEHKAKLQLNSLIFFHDVWIKYDAKFRKCNTFTVTQNTDVEALLNQ